MSDQAKLTMTFRRPDMGHIQFKWVLDDPKTYTRPIGNERVFVLTPDVEVMEYSCMEGNLSALIEGSITPWLGSKDADANLVYDEQHQWTRTIWPTRRSSRASSGRSPATTRCRA